MYSLELFNRIEKTIPHQTVLPDDVGQLLTSLAEQLGLHTHSTKRTVVLLGLLNKLSAETYKEIATQIDLILTEAAYASLYEVVSSNLFYSQLYATLCRYLLRHHPTLKAFLAAKAAEFNLKTVTESNRTKTLFFTNLSLLEVLDPGLCIVIAESLHSHITGHWDDVDYKEQIAEWTEHLVIVVSSKPPVFVQLKPKFSAVAKCSPKEHVALTNRAIFRYEDMLDILK
jgi:hypothetical protein